MTTEQLNQARAEAWHQAGNPILTADDAAEWLREMGVCLFVPRGQQLATAAPSFVEAVLGASAATPAREAIETATGLLQRLLSSGEGVALNLLGTPGEQPDFLATTETLPFLFALVGDKEWKRGPRGKSSPLVIEVWKLLDREGPLTTIEVKEKLGRQLTEAAALRALTELWLHLRVEPVFKQDEPASWQLLERSRQKQMQAGSTMSQAVALSALVSLYLQATVAASGDEIEVFLSPLASRSKVREVVRGLTATRQLSTLNLGPVEMYHVEGSLPEFAEIARPEGAVVEDQGAGGDSGMGEGRRRFVAERLGQEASQSPANGAPAAKRSTRPERPATSPGAERRSPGKTDAPRENRGNTDRRPFAPRPGTPAVERRPYGTRAPGGSSFNPREPWKEDRSAAANARDGERRPFAKNTEESAGERKPFAPRGGAGERKTFVPRTGDRPFKPRSGAEPFGGRGGFDEGKAPSSREGGERKPFARRDGAGAGRKPFASGTGDQSFKPRSDTKAFSGRKSYAPGGGASGARKTFAPREGGAGERKPFAPRDSGERPFKSRSGTAAEGSRSYGERKPFSPREGGPRKPFAPREAGSGERKPFAPRSGDRAYKPRTDAKPYGERKSDGERKSFPPRDGERKAFSPRGGGDRKPRAPRDGGTDDRKPFAPRGSFKPRSDARPSVERKPFTPREGQDRKPSAQRPPAGRLVAGREGERPFKPRADGRPARPAPSGEERKPGARPAYGAGRTASPGARKPAGLRKSPGAGRARTSPMTSSGKVRSGVKPALGRPGPRATRGGAAGAPGRAKRTGRPSKGRS